MTKARPNISLVINVHNEADNLKKCLHSVKDVCDELIVVNMESTDSSQEVAKSFGAKVYTHRYLNFVEPARNFGLSKATGKWILLLDPDEYLKKTLKAELIKITQRKDVDYVKIPRKNLVFGRWLRWSNMWPDYLIRFFKKGAVTWKKEIHSQPTVVGNGITLLDSEKLAINHRNYLSITSFINRALRYSSIQADELKQSGYKLKTSDFILKPVQEFNSRFFRGEGYKDGLHGLAFCLLQAFAICLIYLRLWEKTGTKEKSLPKESFVSAAHEAVFEFSYWFTRFFISEYSTNPVKNFLVRTRQLLFRLTKNF
jgi:(heptosyl)LPS beta-1,4-glucosyltransferase